MAEGASDSQITSTLRRMFGELTEIKVVTAVSPVRVSITPDDAKGKGRTTTTVDTEVTEITNVLVTIFDLVDGDVTNVIAPALKDDEPLRAYHSSQVEKSLTVLPANIKAVVDLGRTLINEFT